MTEIPQTSLPRENINNPSNEHLTLQQLVNAVVEPTPELEDYGIHIGDFFCQKGDRYLNATFSPQKSGRSAKYVLTFFDKEGLNPQQAEKLSPDDEGYTFELPVTSAEDAMQRLTLFWGCKLEDVKYLLPANLNQPNGSSSDVRAFGQFFDERLVDLDTGDGKMRLASVHLGRDPQDNLHLTMKPVPAGVVRRADAYGVVSKAMQACITNGLASSIGETPMLTGTTAQIAASLPVYFPNAAKAVDYGFKRWGKENLVLEGLQTGSPVETLEIKWSNLRQEPTSWKTELDQSGPVYKDTPRIRNRYLPTEKEEQEVDRAIQTQIQQEREAEWEKLALLLQETPNKPDVLLIPEAEWKNMMISDSGMESPRSIEDLQFYASIHIQGSGKYAVFLRPSTLKKPTLLIPNELTPGSFFGPEGQYIKDFEKRSGLNVGRINVVPVDTTHR